MSGYVVADSEALVMQKVGTNVEYKVTEGVRLLMNSSAANVRNVRVDSSPQLYRVLSKFNQQQRRLPQRSTFS